MPSQKILIALRVEPPLYERIVARARADGRSPSNYVAQYLRKGLAGEARQEAARQGPVIDMSGLTRYAAPAPQRPIAPTAEVPEFDPDVWYLAYIKAGEDRHDAEYSVRDECDKRGIKGWVVPSEEGVI